MKALLQFLYAGAACCGLMLLPAVAQAQGKEAIELFTPRQGTLPPWNKPSPDSLDKLTETARELRPGIMLVGVPKVGTGGTAFVISRKHRLLVTNAHVADMFGRVGSMHAIRNGTTVTYQVEQVWYHPGVFRESGTGALVRSMEPKVGEVFTYSPDVAVLKLAAGPEIPQELQLAGWDEVKDLFARPLAMLGFPSYHTESWPKADEKPVATVHTGMVCRVTDFKLKVAGEDARSFQYVQHTAGSWPGFSGSPLFLPSGHVAAVNNSSVPKEHPRQRGRSEIFSYGIRIDCVWELLVHHKLDGQVPVPVPKERLHMARFAEPDPGPELVRQAMAKCAEAAALLNEDKPRPAFEKCTEAIKLASEHAASYGLRSLASARLVSLEAQKLSTKEKIERWKLAIDDARRACELEPVGAYNFTRLARAAWSREELVNSELPAEKRHWTDTRNAVRLLTDLLSWDNLQKWERGEILSLRGVCRYEYGEKKEALKDLNGAIQLVPNDPTPYHWRANIWRREGKTELEEQDRRKVKELSNPPPAGRSRIKPFDPEALSNPAPATGQEDAVRARAQAGVRPNTAIPVKARSSDGGRKLAFHFSVRAGVV